LGTGTDFHSLHKGYHLVLGGIAIPADKGFRVKRSDGDPVSHALVDALLLALGKGDITDWFDDQDDTFNARSIDYLGELYEKVLAILTLCHHLPQAVEASCIAWWDFPKDV